MKLISHEKNLVRAGCIVACLMMLAASEADAQRSKRQSQKKGKTTQVQKKKSARPAASGPRRSTASDSRRVSTTARTGTTVTEPAEQSGPADLAQQTADGGGADQPVQSKRPAPPAPPITAEQLQAMNPYKREMEGLPLRGYAEPERSPRPTRPIYAEGSFGMYMTAGLRAGATGSSWPYDYSAHLSAQTTDGFVDNASRLDLLVGARGGYIIDEGYGIFSGGHMGAEVEYRSEKYRRYALPGAPERAVAGWNVGMNGQNSYDGTTFELNGAYRQLALTDTAEVGEQSFDGSLSIRTPYMGLTLGGDADLHLTYLDDKSISLGRLGGYAKYSTSVFSLRGGFTAGAGENSDGNTTVKIAPLAELNFFPLSGVTLGAGITGGISGSNLQNFLEMNPYVVARPLVQHEVEGLGYTAMVRIEPAQAFGLRVTGARSHYDRYAYFRDTDNALFAPAYDKATVTKITGDLYWEIDPSAMIATMATFMESKLEETGATIPYVPKWDAELMITKRLAAIPLTITATARYIGERETINGTAMEAVPLVGVKGRYRISSLFDISLELNNLSNTRYELWPGYRERGLFGAVGVGIRY